jgi:hypothetical protein
MPSRVFPGAFAESVSWGPLLHLRLRVLSTSVTVWTLICLLAQMDDFLWCQSLCPRFNLFRLCILPLERSWTDVT